MQASIFVDQLEALLNLHDGDIGETLLFCRRILENLSLLPLPSLLPPATIEHADEIEAIGRNATGIDKKHAELLERTIARGLREHDVYTLDTSRGHDTQALICYNIRTPSHRNSHVLVREFTSLADLRKIERVLFKFSSDHAKGVDLCAVDRIECASAHGGHVVVHMTLAQVKMGMSQMTKTKYDDQWNHNKSVSIMYRDMGLVKAGFSRAFASLAFVTTCEVRARCLLVTTRTLTKSGADYIRKHDIEMWDAEHLYARVWPRDIVRAMQSLYPAHTATFGKDPALKAPKKEKGTGKKKIK